MNYNPALSTSFMLEVPFEQELNYNLQTAEVPALTMGGIDVPWRNHQGVQPSNRIDFDPLNVTLIVDEDYKNWHSMFQWMMRIRHGNRSLNAEAVDITLHITDSNKVARHKIVFYGAFPTNVGTLSLETATVEPQPLICALTFRYQHYEFLPTT